MCTAKFNFGNDSEHLELYHLQLTNGPRCARPDLRHIKYSGPWGARGHHNIPNLMLQEDILCRRSGDVLATTYLY